MYTGLSVLCCVYLGHGLFISLTSHPTSCSQSPKVRDEYYRGTLVPMFWETFYCGRNIQGSNELVNQENQRWKKEQKYNWDASTRWYFLLSTVTAVFKILSKIFQNTFSWKFTEEQIQKNVQPWPPIRSAYQYCSLVLAEFSSFYLIQHGLYLFFHATAALKDKWQIGFASLNYNL